MEKFRLRITGDLGFEFWKDIEGYEGYYAVSTYGNILNKHTGKIKQPYTNIKYNRVDLWKDGKREKYLVHLLSADTFLPYPFNSCEISQIDVNHKDENPTNNRIENLEWCTHQYNCCYGTAQTRRRQAMISKGIWKC